MIFPSDVLPAQKVCAVNVQTKQTICTETKQSQVNFSIQVQAGTYHVFANACNGYYEKDKLCSDGYGKESAYYDTKVKCGLTAQCDQTIRVNSPIPVRVNSNEIVEGIKPHNWYFEQSVSALAIILPGRCQMGNAGTLSLLERHC